MFFYHYFYQDFKMKDFLLDFKRACEQPHNLTTRNLSIRESRITYAKEKQNSQKIAKYVKQHKKMFVCFVKNADLCPRL